MAPKKKQEKMSLGTFLGDQSLGSWADEMEDTPVNSSSSRTGYGGDNSRSFGNRPGFGDTSGYSERNYQPRTELPLPTKPPYTAHLGNLSFDVTSADVEDLFTGCDVTNVRIVEDKIDRKPKGFGYVEFGTIDGLKKALEFNSTQFQGRNIRVSIAEPQRGEGREISDWTRKGPLPELTNQRRPSDRGAGGFQRNFDNASDAGSDRGGAPRRNFSFEPSDGKPRDFGNWERKGPLAPTQAPPNQMRDAGRIRSNERSFERKPSPSWGEGRSQDGSRPPRREFQDRPAPERVPTAAETDTQWRTKMRPDAPTPIATPDVSMPSSPVAAAPAAPATRPKLQLQKRTVSDAGSAEPASQAGSSDAKASPFGAARPIDTATKEKEIEEKRLALRLQKEAEEKEREEKKKEENEKKRLAAEKAKAEQVTSPVAENGKSSTREAGKDAAKENGATSPAPVKSFEILRRMTDTENDGSAEADDDATDAPANGVISEHASVKPGEVTRDTTQSQEAATQSGAQALEEDGWQTISKPPRKGKAANGSTRAIAS